MTRITTTIFVIMLLLNGTVTVLEASGFAADAGVVLAPGVEQTMDTIVTETREGFSPSGGFGETLFSLFIAGANVFNLLIEGLYALPNMMLNLGFPVWVVVPFFTPVYVLSTLELVSIATGRRTV